MKALVLILGLAFATLMSAAETPPSSALVVTILVHSETKVTDLTRERVVDLLTGRVTTLNNGGRVVLVMSYCADGEAAVRDLTARDIARLMRGWKRVVFGGGGNLPLTADSTPAAIELLRRTPNGILPLANVDLKTIPVGLQAIVVP